MPRSTMYTKIQGFVKQAKELEDLNDMLAANMKACRAKVHATERENEALRFTLKSGEKELNALNALLCRVQESADEKIAELKQTLEQRTADSKEQIAKLLEDIDQAREEESDMTRDFNELRASLKKMEAKLAQKDAELDAMRAEFAQMKAELKQTQGKLSQTTRELEQTRATLKKTREKLSEAKQKAHHEEQQRISAEAKAAKAAKATAKATAEAAAAEKKAASAAEELKARNLEDAAASVAIDEFVERVGEKVKERTKVAIRDMNWLQKGERVNMRLANGSEVSISKTSAI